MSQLTISAFCCSTRPSSTIGSVSMVESKRKRKEKRKKSIRKNKELRLWHWSNSEIWVEWIETHTDRRRKVRKRYVIHPLRVQRHPIGVNLLWENVMPIPQVYKGSRTWVENNREDVPKDILVGTSTIEAICEIQVFSESVLIGWHVHGFSRWLKQYTYQGDWINTDDGQTSSAD